jgi:selT/selW/selH-like putative selenoprotein
VRGENHPPTALGQAAVQFAAVTQVASTCLAFFGDHLFAAVGLDRSPWARSISDNKLQVLGLSFLFNSVAQSMAKTDAFEVYVNGELVFSKLEKKRMPTIEEVFDALSERGVSIPSHSAISRKATPGKMQM